MTISVIQAILIGLLYYLGINGTPWTTLLGSTILQKPLVSGVLVGCILGDPVQGAIIGAAIQLPFIAYISAGGAPPTDPGLAGTLGTALAMAAGVKPEAAIAMAVPIGLLGTIIWVLHMTIDVFFVHMIDKAADEGNMKKAEFLHIVPPQIVALLLVQFQWHWVVIWIRCCNKNYYTFRWYTIKNIGSYWWNLTSNRYRNESSSN